MASAGHNERPALRTPGALWVVYAAFSAQSAALLAGCLALLLASPLFEWQRNVSDMPAAALGAAMAVVGATYCLLVPALRASGTLEAGARRRLLLMGCLVGAAARGLLFFSEPALEDDFYRYLSEGALSAHLISPYTTTVRDILSAAPGTQLGRLAQEGAPVLARVSYPDMTSNYPPVAQVAFAAAYVLGPWSLSAWKLLVLGFDAATMLLLAALLRCANRDTLWALLYWLNPLVIKELANSAHMDALIVLLVLASALLAARDRPYLALTVIGLAIGAKLWPILLVPLLLRPLTRSPLSAIAGACVVAAVVAGVLSPIWSQAAAMHDGFVAFGRYWRTNSAFFPVFEDAIASIAAVIGHGESAWILARGAVGAALASLALWTARAPVSDVGDLMGRIGLITLWLFLLSPVQFPWYAIWTIPFAAFHPRLSLLAMTIFLPLYYSSFHFLARDAYTTFSGAVVWAIWTPISLAVVVDWLSRGHRAARISLRASPARD